MSAEENKEDLRVAAEIGQALLEQNLAQRRAIEILESDRSDEFGDCVSEK